MRRLFEKLRDTNPCTAFGIIFLYMLAYYIQKPLLKCIEYVEKINTLI